MAKLSGTIQPDRTVSSLMFGLLWLSFSLGNAHAVSEATLLFFFLCNLGCFGGH